MFAPHSRVRGSLPRRLLTLSAVWVCCLASGCQGGSANRFDISGTVTFEDKPVPAGMIYFSPDRTKHNDGPQGYAEIHDGSYDTRQTGKGSRGGPVHVHIEGFDGQQAEDQPFGRALFFHDVDTELPRATATKDFQVPASAAKNVPKRKGRPV